jgi:transposase-like protein
MGGQRVSVRKPRVRQNGREVELPSWAAFADKDPLNERMVEQIAPGVSTRGYRRSIEELPTELDADSTSKNAVSRRLVSLTQQQLDAWLARDLSEERIAAVMVDGIEVAGHTINVALGITETGEKQPLGLWDGATENSAVCQSLLDNLVERGLAPQRAYLSAIDGSKAMRDTFGDASSPRGARSTSCATCSRICRRSCTPASARSPAMLTGAPRRPSLRTIAKRRLLQLVARLESTHTGAAASLKEGLDGILTLKDLGLSEALERTLSTTNPIENLNGTIRRSNAAFAGGATRP